MKPKMIKILLFSLLLAGPMVLAYFYEPLKLVIFIFIAILIYHQINQRIRSTTLKLVFFGAFMFIFYQLWMVLGALIMFYYIAGSLGFSFISSIIIFGVGRG
ncbi:MAG: hypothetical protein ACOCTT_02080 [archaeon]